MFQYQIFANDSFQAIGTRPKKSGNIVKHYWEMIPEYHPHVILDEYVIMPNHVHGIIHINNNINGNHIDRGNRAQGIAPLRNKFGRIISGSLDSLNKIREYIVNNPSTWANDKHNIMNYSIEDKACLVPTEYYL